MAIGSVRVSVVIPTLNEAENLPHVFPRLPDGFHEVILVDGHSTDGTIEVARRLRPDVRVVRRTGKGKGNALAAGFAAATGDIFVMLDADGSTDAAEIPRFVAALLQRRRLREGIAVRPGRGELGHHLHAAARQPGLNTLVNRSTGRATRTSATATTRSGRAACRTCASTATASRSRPSSTSGSPRAASSSTRCRATSATGSMGEQPATRSATASRVLRTIARERAIGAAGAARPPRPPAASRRLMHIALVASSYRPRSDGLDRHVGKLATALARRGAHVEVLTQDAGRRASRRSSIDGVTGPPLLPPVGASHGAVAPGLWDALRRSSRAFDLVHVHTPHPSFAAGRDAGRPAAEGVHAARAREAPHPVALHACHARASWSTPPSRSAPRSPRAHCSRSGSRGPRRRIGALAGRGRRCDRGCGADRPRGEGGPGARTARPAPAIDRAIGAMAGLADDYRLVIAGAGPAARRLAAHAEDLRVASRVDFVGPVGDAELYRWLRTARVLIALADQGTSGIEVTEAISAGIPVVASDIPVHREAAGRAGGGATSCHRRDRHSRSPTRSRLPSVLARLVAAPATLPSWDGVADSRLAL